jgi:hypothetical protein
MCLPFIFCIPENNNAIFCIEVNPYLKNFFLKMTMATITMTAARNPFNKVLEHRWNCLVICHVYLTDFFLSMGNMCRVFYFKPQRFWLREKQKTVIFATKRQVA